MPNEKPGYQFTIFDQISDNNNAKDTQKKMQEAIAQIERKYAEKITKKRNDIDALRAYDPDDKDSETRKEIREEEMELHELEAERDRKIAEIRAGQSPNSR